MSEPLTDGILQGLALCYRAVLPALLPSMVLCGILGDWLEVLPLPPTISLWVTSQLCGFPLGIRTVAQCYRRGLISREQAIRLSVCCSNASPAFLVTYVGGGILGSAREGWILYLGQLLISFHAGVLMEVFRGSPAQKYQPSPFLKTVTNSFSGAAKGALNLTVYITFFSAVASLCKKAPVLYGSLELVGGIGAVGQNKLLIAALVGFSGWAVMMQNGTYLIQEQLPLWPMLVAKLGYAVLLPLFVLLLSKNLLFYLFLLTLPAILIICFDKFRKRGYNELKIN